MAGTFSLTSLPNYDFEFFFAGGTTFTTADITTPVANVEVAISLLGSDFSVNFGGSGGGEGSGSIDFNNGGNELSFQPDFGSLYRLNESIGTYQGITPVPGPLPLLGAGAAFGWSRKIRKRIKSSRPEVIPTSTVLDGESADRQGLQLQPAELAAAAGDSSKLPAAVRGYSNSNSGLNVWMRRKGRSTAVQGGQRHHQGDDMNSGGEQGLGGDQRQQQGLLHRTRGIAWLRSVVGVGGPLRANFRPTGTTGTGAIRQLHLIPHSFPKNPEALGGVQFFAANPCWEWRSSLVAAPFQVRVRLQCVPL